MVREMTYFQRAIAVAALIAVAISTLALLPDAARGEESQTQGAGPWASSKEIMRFDVAENALRFFYDEAPVDENGMPAAGNTFVTEGYIYPEGALNGSNGVLANGDPEFPEKVIGTWYCRGYFVNDGAASTTGPMVLTTQFYQFGPEYGNTTLISEGLELVDIGTPVARAITGGTGKYTTAGGEATQTLLGFTEQMGVNLTFELEVYKLRATPSWFGID